MSCQGEKMIHLTAVMCLTEEFQTTAQLVGENPHRRGHPAILLTLSLVQFRILLVEY